MFRLLAVFCLAILAGCGSSTTREVSYGAPAPTNEVGISKPYQLVPWKSRCVGGTCGTFKKEPENVVTHQLPPIGSNTASTPSMPAIPSSSSASSAPAEIVPTEPVKVTETTTTESMSGGSKVTTTTTTTRVIRRPRALQ